MFYKHLIRPLWFKLSRRDPENAHEQALGLLGFIARRLWLKKLIQWRTNVKAPNLARELWGLRFPNPVGLAAGFDKNAVAISGLAALGFGFIEIGGVTRYAQPGNPRPRIFRLPKDHGLINRMGFNNHGADDLARRLAATEHEWGTLGIPLGINIGKSKIASLDDAEDDYCYSLRRLYPYGDFFTINVSSPNTPELRQLQEKRRLSGLIKRLLVCVGSVVYIERNATNQKPLLVKIAPDLSWPEIDDVLEVCDDCGVHGIVATNTTISRDGLNTPTSETGGLSGRPLHVRALEVVRYIAHHTEDRLPIIGVGGIDSPKTACAMLDAGASLIQLFTGLVYEGPFLPKRIVKGLTKRTTNTPTPA